MLWRCTVLHVRSRTSTCPRTGSSDRHRSGKSSPLSCGNITHNLVRFLDALFHTVDGNFHQNQKMKPLDREDFPLSLGAGYFAHEEEFEKFQKLLGPMEPEVRVTRAIRRASAYVR